MKSSIRPVPLLLFLSVVFLIASYRVYDYAGPLLFLASGMVFACGTGWIVGRNWLLYPWQIGVITAIPSILFVLWRFYTRTTPEEVNQNISTFIFHPLTVLIGAHFGGLVGRWRALRRRAASTRTGPPAGS